MPLLLTDFEFRRDIQFKTPKKEMTEYIKKIDPYFDLRRLPTLFGNRAYYMNGHWHAVGIPSNADEIIKEAQKRYTVDEGVIKVAENLGLILRVDGYVARADQLNAVAKARGLDFRTPSSIENYSVFWKGFVSQIHQVTYETHPSSKPLTAYDLTYWVNRWCDEPVTEEEVIAAVDRETIRVKLNWDMGTGIAWKGIRLLNVFDLDWYTGRFPEKIAMNDGKNPPPPGEEYGYGYASLTEAAEARSMIIGDGNDD